MDLQTLAQQSVELHRQLKALELQLTAANDALLNQMVAENVSTIKVERRTVSLVTRRTKDFGDDIKQQELILKAEKKRREVMGQFTIASTSQSIRINWQSRGTNHPPISHKPTPLFITMEPKFALVDANDGNYLVESFDPTIGGRHMSLAGFSRPDVTLFTDVSEVEHLRNRIINW